MPHNALGQLGRRPPQAAEAGTRLLCAGGYPGVAWGRSRRLSRDVVCAAD